MSSPPKRESRFVRAIGVNSLLFAITALPILFLGAWPGYIARHPLRPPYLLNEVILGIVPLSLACFTLIGLMLLIPPLAEGEPRPWLDFPLEFTLPVLWAMTSCAFATFATGPVSDLDVVVRLDQLWREPIALLVLIVWQFFGLKAGIAIAGRSKQPE